MSSVLVRALLLSLGLGVAAASSSAPAGAWSLSREAVRPALDAARDGVRRCALEQAAPDGRYVVWIVVGPNGAAGATVRDAPDAAGTAARRCIAAAYAGQRYPTPLAATVAWSAASPPQRTYSIAYPLELRVHAYGWHDGSDARIRPRPARSVTLLHAGAD